MLREQRQILNYRLYHKLMYYNILHYKILCYILPVITMFSELEDDLDWLLHVVVTDLPRNLSEKKENKNLWVRANPHGGCCCQLFSDPMEMATHSSIFVWRIPWTEEPDRLQPLGLKESDTKEHAHTRHQLFEVCIVIISLLKLRKWKL